MRCYPLLSALMFVWMVLLSACGGGGGGGPVLDSGLDTSVEADGGSDSAEADTAIMDGAGEHAVAVAVGSAEVFFFVQTSII